MIRLIMTLALATLAPLAKALSLDLGPISLNFQLGFNTSFAPGPNDTSHALGLVVTPDKILTDKTRSLVATGTITNHGPLPCQDVAMHVAVTSYVGTGASFGAAAVHPTTIPPGGSATFNVHVTLDAQKPRHVMYTVTAGSPPLAPIHVYGQTVLPGTAVVAAPPAAIPAATDP